MYALLKNPKFIRENYLLLCGISSRYKTNIYEQKFNSSAWVNEIKLQKRPHQKFCLEPLHQFAYFFGPEFKMAQLRSEKLENHENLYFLEACPNTSVKRDFSRTHRQTQRMYSWIGLDLTEAGKLLRSETNLQILRYLHFSKPFTPIFDKPSWCRFPLPLYYS